MTDDDLTRRAIIAAHDAECADRCEATVMPSLSKREQAIVKRWREDRDEWSEQFGGLVECGGEGVDCDTHPVTLVEHEGPVACVWCALAVERERAEKAEAMAGRVRLLCIGNAKPGRKRGVIRGSVSVDDVIQALDGTEATDG